jgi:hypothetical protein
MSATAALLVAALAAPAHAGQVVIHEGDAKDAVDRVASRAGVDPSSLQPIALTDLTMGKQPQIRGGTLEGCTAEKSSLEELGKHIAAAEDSLHAPDDYEFALGPAKAAEKAASCISDPLPPDLLARVMWAKGIGLAATDDAQGARSAWAEAFRLDPKTDWTAKAPPEMLGEVKIAAEESARQDVELWLVPPGKISIDGVVTTADRVRLAAGSHWVRLGDENERMTLDPTGSPVLVVPSEVPLGATGWAADQDLGQELGRLVDLLVPPESGPVYVVTTSGRVFERTPTGWEEKSQAEKGAGAGVALLPIGAVVTVAGGVLAGTAIGAGNSAVDQASVAGVTLDGWQAAHDKYTGAQTRLVVGDVLIGAGVVVMGVGGGLLLDGVSVSPLWLRGGGGLGLSVSLGGR